MAKILIVDDSQVIRDLLREYLSENGYDVDTAVDGADGVEKALKGDFAAVICDIHMPRKNGYQVFTEVTAANPTVRFIMTDSLPDELARMAENAGAYCCLTKPFDLDQVKRTVKTVLSPAKTT